MTVHELMEQLSNLAQDAEVRIPYPDNGPGFWPITGLTHDGRCVDLYADED